MEMKALSLKYSNPVLSQIQGCAIFLRYWVKLLHSGDGCKQGCFLCTFPSNPPRDLCGFFELAHFGT